MNRKFDLSSRYHRAAEWSIDHFFITPLALLIRVLNTVFPEEEASPSSWRYLLEIRNTLQEQQELFSSILTELDDALERLRAHQQRIALRPADEQTRSKLEKAVNSLRSQRARHQSDLREIRDRLDEISLAIHVLDPDLEIRDSDTLQ